MPRLDGPRFGDREHRLVLDGLGPDAERGEMVEERLGREMGTIWNSRVQTRSRGW